jgi:hypothetical protein
VSIAIALLELDRVKVSLNKYLAGSPQGIASSSPLRVTLETEVKVALSLISVFFVIGEQSSVPVSSPRSCAKFLDTM